MVSCERGSFPTACITRGGSAPSSPPPHRQLDACKRRCSRAAKCRRCTMISMRARFYDSHAEGENNASVAPETLSIGSSLFEIRDDCRAL